MPCLLAQWSYIESTCATRARKPCCSSNSGVLKYSIQPVKQPLQQRSRVGETTWHSAPSVSHGQLHLHPVATAWEGHTSRVWTRLRLGHPCWSDQCSSVAAASCTLWPLRHGDVTDVAVDPATECGVFDREVWHNTVTGRMRLCGAVVLYRRLCCTVPDSCFYGTKVALYRLSGNVMTG